MNKTQKTAIFCLATFLFSAVVMAYPFITIFIFKSWPSCIIVTYLIVPVFIVGTMASIFSLRKKQSPFEPNSDERDELIKKRAVLVCLISVWILLIASYAILWHIVGLDGSIPLCILPLIYLGVFFAAMLVYNVAILVQYGWRGKDGEG